MKKPVWYKASSEQIDNYTFTLSEKIENIPEPDCLKCSNCNCNDISHSVDRDSYFMDILCTIIETSHLTIPLTSGRGKRKTVNNSPINRAIPGWKDKVEPFRNDSIFWHDIWINSGRPYKGMIFEIMKRTRNKYHYTVRSVKKEAEVINSKLLLDAAQKGNIT